MRLAPSTTLAAAVLLFTQSLVSVISTSTAFASDTETAEPSGLLSRTSLSHTTFAFQGPEEDGGAISLENEPALSYALNSGATIALALPWAWTPQFNDASLGDLWLGVANESLYAGPAMEYGAALRLGLPTSDWARQNRQISYLAAEQLLTWRFVSTRWSLELYSWLQGNIFSGPGKGERFSINLSPAVKFQAAAPLFIYFKVENDYTRTRARNEQESPRLALQPGLSWDLTPSLNFSPHLQLSRNSDAGGLDPALRASLSWTLL